MNSMLHYILGLCFLIVAVAMRCMAFQFYKKLNFKVRFALGIGLFVGYTILLQIYMYFIYQLMINPTMPSAQIYPLLSVALMIFHLTALLIGIIYYLMQNKRKISDIEKMKLKDL